GIPNFGPWATADLQPLLNLARGADAAGVDRLVVSDHVLLGDHTDAYRWGRFPTPPDGAWLEPLACLTAFAAVTSRVRLSTGTLTDRTVRRVSELGDGWIPIMGASIDDIRSGAKRLRDATERPLDIQAPLTPVRRDDRSVDLDAMLGQIPELAAAGVTNVYVN